MPVGLTVAERLVARGHVGQDVHVHPGRDDAIYVLQGVAVVRVGRLRVELGPGSFALLPGNVAHGYAAQHGSDLRLLLLSLPSAPA
jgi:quercetin dioxygenase-like cupin family protein